MGWLLDDINNYNYFLIFIIVNLQCSINFCCTAKLPSYIYIYIYIYIYTHIYIYTYIDMHRYIHRYILFFTLSSIMFHHKWLDIVAHAIQQDLILLIHCNPKLPVHPTSSPSSKSVLHVHERFFSVDRFTCALYQIPDMSDIIWYFSLSDSLHLVWEPLVPSISLQMA